MQIEYVTDAVPWPALRCVKCRGKVRQMREDFSARQNVLIFLCGEPLVWVVAGVGLLVGYLAEAIALVVIAYAVLAPPGLFWLYMSRLHRASFLCSDCGHIGGYVESRRSASQVRPGHP